MHFHAQPPKCLKIDKGMDGFLFFCSLPLNSLIKTIILKIQIKTFNNELYSIQHKRFQSLNSTEPKTVINRL